MPEIPFDKPTLGPCKVELWPFQWRAVEAVRDEFKKGVRRTLLTMATGLGKTIVAAMIGRLSIEKGSRVLFLAHTDELIQQTAAKFDLLGVEPGVEQGPQFARAMFDPDVVVASFMTMLQPGRLESWSDDYFDLVIVDEGHRALSEGYKKILSYFRKARVVLLTATHLRMDEQEIGHIAESLAFRFTVLDAWEEEKKTGQQYLCDVRMIRADVDIDLRKLKAGKNDFSPEDVDARIAPMIETICNKVREYIGNDKTVGFFPSIRSAQMFAAGMGKWFESEAVWGNDPERKQKIKRYRDGDLQLLSNMNMLIEGWDVPETTNVILGRPTKSWSMILQQIGRGLRAGKEACRVIDFNYITDQFGETPAALFVQPLGIMGGEGFDQEVNRIVAEMLRNKPELSLKDAIEEAKTEFDDRQRKKQFAVKIAIAERQIECYEEQFSVKESLGDGDAFTGRTFATPIKIRPATEGQIRYLRSLGIFNCENWSFQRATTEISLLKRQLDAGRSTYMQRTKLIRGGVDAAEAREMSRTDAESVIDQWEKRRQEVYGRRRG